MNSQQRGGGFGALVIAYVLVLALIAGVIGLSLMGRQHSSAGIEIEPAKAATASSSSVAIAPASPAPASPASPAPPVAPSPSVASVPAPPPPAAPAPADSAMPPMGANGYPPPPPEKPSAAARQADASPPPAAPAPPAAAPPAPAPQAAAPATPPAPSPAPPDAPPSTVPPAAPPSVAAAPAGSPLLSENGPYGPLPRIAADGRLPWIVNNARFDHRTRTPRVAIVLVGLGLDAKSTEDAIVKLPPEVSLAFLPYATSLDRWTKLARDFGHEVLISLPMEGGDPTSQQALGPRMLSTKATTAENLDRLRWVMSRATGYIGLVTWEGESFLASDNATLPILQEISNRGLMVVDSRSAKANSVQQLGTPIGLPFAKSRGFFDEPRDGPSIDANLATLEDLARRNNFAMAMAVAFPVSIERLVNWSRTVGQRGIVLAPVSGVTQCTDLCQTRVQRHAAAVAALQNK